MSCTGIILYYIISYYTLKGEIYKLCYPFKGSKGLSPCERLPSSSCPHPLAASAQTNSLHLGFVRHVLQ